MNYSVIDISSSSLSMIVASTEKNKTEIVFKDRVALSLVHYLYGHCLSARGIDKLVDCLRGMKETCERLGSERCYLISTAALRHIENFEEVRLRVLQDTGLPVNFIDGSTEAYCDYVANIYYSSCERPVLIDLGGKSIEICDLGKQSREEMRCFSFGLLDLYRKFVKNIYPDEEEAKAIRKFVGRKFDRADIPAAGVYSTAVMVGATNAAMYDIYADFADEKATEVKTIRYKKFKKLVGRLLTGEDRSKLILNNAPEKFHLVGVAAVVLKFLFKRFGVDNIVVSDRGVKEGYLELVLRGEETGLYYDFRKKTVDGSERVLPPLIDTQGEGDKKGKRAKSAGGKTKPVKPPQKAQNEAKEAERPAVSAETSVSAAEATASAPKARRTRRSRKPAEEKREEGKAAEVPAAPRRGRPRKSAAAPVAERKTKSADKAKEEAPMPENNGINE